MDDTPLQRLSGVLAPAERARLLHRRACIEFMSGMKFERARGTLVGVAQARGHWLARSGSLVVAVAGKPWFDASATDGETPDPARRFLDEFRGRGVAALERIRGSFAICAIDADAGHAMLAIDRMGVETMCYGSAGKDLIFATRADSVAEFLDGACAIDPQAVFDYLFFHTVPAPGTIFKGIGKLLPAQYLEYRDGALRLGYYWRMHYVDEPTTPRGPLCARFRELLPQAVARQLDERPVGTFLSGGTDSSTVTGILSQVQERPVDAYSIGFHAEGFDEMHYARIAAERYGVRHHPYYVTPADVVAAVPRIAAAYDEPFGNASAVPVYYCARQAWQDGVRLMLAGDGGDELFGGNARYAKQSAFEAYALVPAAWRTALVEPLVLGMPALQRLPLLRKLRSYVEQARVALPERLESYNFLCRADLASMLEPEFLAAIRPAHPFSLMREVYERTDSQSPVNRMLHLDLKQTLSDNDLRKVSIMCRLAGIDVRYPMLDDEMVALSGTVPPSGKVHRLRLRPFFKDALKDFLPGEILAKTKHGFGLPFGPWMLEHRPLRELAGDSLCAFGRRGYLRPGYLDRLLKQQRSGHASYYGVMVWVVTMLEQWLELRSPKPRAG